MALPAFNEEGDLPPGVHPAVLSEVLERFGRGPVQRCAVSDWLTRLYQLVTSTGQLARFVVFGPFVPAKEEPNDVDIILLMGDTFDLASVTGEAALVFQHMEAGAHFGASVFRARRSGAIGGEQATMVLAFAMIARAKVFRSLAVEEAERERRRQATGRLIGYFARHTTRLSYAERLQAGRVIGSGQVEGKAKTLYRIR